jgi:hypothetical protein
MKYQLNHQKISSELLICLHFLNESFNHEDRLSHLITFQTVFSLAQRAREIFESSNIDKKQQLLKFVYSNLRLNAGKIDSELREPFLSTGKIKDHTVWLGREDSNLRITGPKPVALPLGHTPTNLSNIYQDNCY